MQIGKCWRKTNRVYDRTVPLAAGFELLRSWYISKVFKVFHSPTMTIQTVTKHSKQYSLTCSMDSAADKEERKREVRTIICTQSLVFDKN
jgi:hypothetical protein